MTYHTRAQASYDPEELELCNELNSATDIRYLTELLQNGDMRAFYSVADRVLRVKPANPVVMKITTDNGDIVNDRDEVDRQIKVYFEAICKAPDDWANRMEGIKEQKVPNQLLYFNQNEVE